MSTIRAKDRDAVIQSLKAGVVPKSGQHLIQVGRMKELEALIQDIERIAEGGSSFRLIIGEYGAGKTFFRILFARLLWRKNSSPPTQTSIQIAGSMPLEVKLDHFTRNWQETYPHAPSRMAARLPESSRSSSHRQSQRQKQQEKPRMRPFMLGSGSYPRW